MFEVVTGMCLFTFILIYFLHDYIYAYVRYIPSEFISFFSVVRLGCESVICIIDFW